MIANLKQELQRTFILCLCALKLMTTSLLIIVVWTFLLAAWS